MRIDIQSSILINFILTILMTVYLLLFWVNNRHQNKGIGLFLIGNSLVSCFTLLLWFQGNLPDVFSIIAANSVVIIGQILIYKSFYIFSGREMEKITLILSVIIPVLIIAEQTIFSRFIPNTKVRIISMTIAGLYCNLVMINVLLKSRKAFGITGTILIISVCILTLNSVARIVMSFYLPMIKTFINAPAVQSTFVIVRSIIMAFWPFGFAMLVLDKGKREAENSTQQKTILLRELSHRTKNNMSIIISLIDMQIIKLPENLGDGKPYILHLLNTTKSRIYSLSLVNKLLINSDDLSRINVKAYLNELIGKVRKSIASGKNKIDIQADFSDIILSLETAGYIGLIVNEMLSNSIRYAFPGEREGLISISINLHEDGTLVFSYADNGTGIPSEYLKSENCTGLSMIRLLSEKQLEGNMKISSVNGFQYSLRFMDNLYKARV